MVPQYCSQATVRAGSFEMKYIPPRDKFDLFIQQLVVWLLNVYPALYPALGVLIREVFETHCPQESDIIKWDLALGHIGSTITPPLPHHLLLNRCAMDGNLLNYFSKQLATELNGFKWLGYAASSVFHYIYVHVYPAYCRCVYSETHLS